MRSATLRAWLSVESERRSRAKISASLMRSGAERFRRPCSMRFR
jgi:hypothetical protein